MNRILELLEKNSTLTVADIAVMLDKSEEEISAAIEQFKKDGIILGSKMLVNWQKTTREYVTAFIELKVTPQFGKGFDQIAERFYQYEQVKTVYPNSPTVSGCSTKNRGIAYPSLFTLQTRHSQPPCSYRSTTVKPQATSAACTSAS